MGVPWVLTSAHTKERMDDLIALCEPGKTIAFVGSSGVGKSTLINQLMGTEQQATSEIRKRDQTGRHTTTRQEMLITPQGAILIDTTRYA